jgi:hypothetical protein
MGPLISQTKLNSGYDSSFTDDGFEDQKYKKLLRDPQ